MWSDPLAGNAHYESVRVLGRGSHSLVQLCRDRATGEAVAIKLIQRGARRPGLRRGQPRPRAARAAGAAPGAAPRPPSTGVSREAWRARARAPQQPPHARPSRRGPARAPTPAGWDPIQSKYVERELLNHQELSASRHPHIVEFREVGGGASERGGVARRRPAAVHGAEAAPAQ
jgi:serine/threonine protein kinase